MAEKRTISIIGAGPAGLAAAIALRNNGYPVRVFEKSPKAGHRFHGDFQGLENWTNESDILDSLREIGIDINFLCSPFYGGTMYLPGGEAVRIRSERPMFYLVRRGPMPGTLDSGLKEQALAAGAEIIFNHRAEPSEVDIVGSGPKGYVILIAGINFKTSMADAAFAVLDDDLAPKGYSYLLVNQGLGTVATVLFRDFTKVGECLEKSLEFFSTKVDLDMRSERRFGGKINFFIRDSHVEDGRLHIGEAAGFQDCLWGFGMRYAMTSGHLAARSIIEGTDYDSLWKENFGPTLYTSLVNRRLYEWFGHLGYRTVTRRLAKSESPCDYLRRHYALSPFKRLLLPICRGKFKR
jgi:flavin-dependent dehydrogenase